MNKTPHKYKLTDIFGLQLDTRYFQDKYIKPFFFFFFFFEASVFDKYKNVLEICVLSNY